MNVDAILVPQGSEYKSVCAGLNCVTAPTPPVFPIPIGPAALTRYLEKWQQAGHLCTDRQPRVLLMGLCGSLSPRHSVGDVVLYQSCLYNRLGLESQESSRKTLEEEDALQLQTCDSELTAILHRQLKTRVFLGTGLTSDRLIYLASEKRRLGQTYAADVVDMEGFVALEILSRAGIAVAILRAISDDCHYNIPNLSSALCADGSLQSLPLAIQLLRQPVAATRLIRGALQGLRVLQNITTSLFTED